MSTFGELLTGYLRISPDSVRALAAQWDVNPASVSRWASGQQVPSDDKAPQLAEILGLTVDEVITALDHGRARDTYRRLRALEEENARLEAEVGELQAWRRQAEKLLPKPWDGVERRRASKPRSLPASPRRRAT